MDKPLEVCIYLLDLVRNPQIFLFLRSASVQRGTLTVNQPGRITQRVVDLLKGLLSGVEK